MHVCEFDYWVILIVKISEMRERGRKREGEWGGGGGIGKSWTFFKLES